MALTRVVYRAHRSVLTHRHPEVFALNIIVIAPDDVITSRVQWRGLEVRLVESSLRLVHQ